MWSAASNLTSCYHYEDQESTSPKGTGVKPAEKEAAISRNPQDWLYYLPCFPSSGRNNADWLAEGVNTDHKHRGC